MPTLNCRQCGTEFYQKPSRITAGKGKYCSVRCYGLARRKNEVRTCPVCNAEFIVRPSEKKVYCSTECVALALQRRVVSRCKECNAEFEHTRGSLVKFCSRKCYLVWVRRKGKEHWEAVICPVCGTPFEKQHSDTRVCCSAGCGNVYKRKRIPVPCETCGVEFEALPSNIERGHDRFCSWSCFNEWRKTRVGDLAPNWRGGRMPQVYPKAFNAQFRREIRDRDDYTCAICKLSGSDVHHINYVKEDSGADNCITLCKSCHAKTNVKRNYWEGALTQLMTARSY